MIDNNTSGERTADSVFDAKTAGVGTTIGVGIGSILGVALDDTGTGITLGIGIGLAIAIAGRLAMRRPKSPG
jgi:hypothetical protein